MKSAAAGFSLAPNTKPFPADSADPDGERQNLPIQGVSGALGGWCGAACSLNCNQNFNRY
ncbi:MAG TPA: hypothetical protein DC058_14610 [Planctomycetaceae bacterium]|nr:hypothetical protein [Planctomycetaceae bacterium]HBC62430.1 hypothetical protein [Planctomycetaceae bacterium]